jgi:hypothetical protein
MSQYFEATARFPQRCTICLGTWDAAHQLDGCTVAPPDAPLAEVHVYPHHKTTTHSGMWIWAGVSDSDLHNWLNERFPGWLHVQLTRTLANALPEAEYMEDSARADAYDAGGFAQRDHDMAMAQAFTEQETAAQTSAGMPDTEDWINDPAGAALAAQAQFEQWAEFGQDTGECGGCGSTLDANEKEAGLCYSCQDAYGYDD